MQTEANFGSRENIEASSPAEARLGGMHSEGVATTVRAAVEVDVANASTVVESSDAALQLAEDLKKFQKLAAEIRATLAPAADFSARCDQAFSLANDLFGHAPTWVCFFREVLADGGLARKLFPTIEDYEQFMTTSHYDQIQQMLTGLRSRDLPENDPNDPQRMITVRLPKSLHKALCDEARRLNISVNKLCISRLLQILDPKMIPETVSKPRGRKPRTHSEESMEARPAAAVVS
jgi:hypothetical protein